MEANEFVANLKADGSECDVCDLDQVFGEYRRISSTLSAKDRGQFSLNILCILCRNLEKVQSWRNKVQFNALLTLSIYCVEETPSLKCDDKVKVLACIYNIHKCAVHQIAPIDPKILLKLSYMPFDTETNDLLKEYAKTYWNILADRLVYKEKLKAQKISTVKQLPKLTDDLVKIIQIYDTAQLCSKTLVFCIKKLYYIYADHPVNLNTSFEQIFQSIAKKNDLLSGKLTNQDVLDIFAKFNACFYVIAENSSKILFKDSALPSIVRMSMLLFKTRPDVFHCLRTLYQYGFCSLLIESTNSNFTVNKFHVMLTSIEDCEKLGYKEVMHLTYPYLSQLLQLYIEYSVANKEIHSWKENFNENIQENCLKLMLFLMKKIRNCQQLMKCENCPVKNGLHDGLRLSFSVKNFIQISISQGLDISQILPFYLPIVVEQHKILTELSKLGCQNREKCIKKIQADIHNTAILLNKNSHHEYSLKLFELYLKNEIQYFKTESDMKNIGRGFYNKAICELDSRLHESSLKSAFLSLLFLYPQSLDTEKYISLIIDIKSKALKLQSSDLNDSEDGENQDRLQLMTCLDACDLVLKNREYGNLRPFFAHLKFSELLNRELSIYGKLWPSIVPIAGIWNSMVDILERKHRDWLRPEADQADILRKTCEMVIDTASIVRTIHSDYYSRVVRMLTRRLDEEKDKTTEMNAKHAALLFLQAEYDVAAASEKYCWKITEPDPDIKKITLCRTMAQEHTALKEAIRAVDILTELLPLLKKEESPGYLKGALQIYQPASYLLLLFGRTAEGLQMAFICCEVAEILDDCSSYIRSAGTILSHAHRESDMTAKILRDDAKRFRRLLRRAECVETAVTYCCDVAIFRANCGDRSGAARLVQLAQTKVVAITKKLPDVNLDLAIGRLLEVQARLCSAGDGPTALTAVIGTQRHYLKVGNNETRWSGRRLRALAARRCLSQSSVAAVSRCRSLRLCRRARASLAAALPAAAAVAQLTMLLRAVDCYSDDAQVQIDMQLKHILGLPTSESQPKHQAAESRIATKTPMFTPKSKALGDPIRDCQVFKKTQTSPSLSHFAVPGFKMADVFTHKNGCQCYACDNPAFFILALLTIGLEASTYFRCKDIDIAKNYFDGALKLFPLVESKLKLRKDAKIEGFIKEIVENQLIQDFQNAQVEILIEAAFLEMSLNNFEESDEFTVQIHNIMQEMKFVCPYLNIEVMNLMLASAKLRKVRKSADVDLLEVQADLDNLKLSPEKYNNMEPPRTPEAKAKNPPIDVKSKIIVNKEELPCKRSKLKFNLHDEEESSAEKPKRTTKFKIPEPVISKPVPETITPRPPRSKPVLVVTQSSLDIESKQSVEEFRTPKDNKKQQFYTPKDIFSTPVSDAAFFTPMAAAKTYSKKGLRHDLVKKLEQDFSTPKADKENDKNNSQDTETRIKRAETSSLRSTKVATGSEKSTDNVSKLATSSRPTKDTIKGETGIPISTKSITKLESRSDIDASGVEGGSSKSTKDKRVLKRATSPGKLSKEAREKGAIARTRRQIRKPGTSDDNDEKK